MELLEISDKQASKLLSEHWGFLGSQVNIVWREKAVASGLAFVLFDISSGRPLIRPNCEGLETRSLLCCALCCESW